MTLQLLTVETCREEYLDWHVDRRRANRTPRRRVAFVIFCMKGMSSVLSLSQDDGPI